MAPRIGECLPEILELKVALVLVEFEPMVVVVPFLVESELFHGGVVEDRWLSVASRAHRLNQGLLLPIASRPPWPRSRRARSRHWQDRARPERPTAAVAGGGRSAARRRPVAGLLHPRGGRCGSQRLPALPSTPEDKVER